ncbi:PREDICTED: ubiquitin-like-specific protease 1D isoform X2 [Lupinus angustifolius]|uniref:ubiquitin-like-specific protease 1D isoform X2 n=1 Tax=Lupinus angustifolius TaxID=3871 RepID=UPI00092F04E0|nr:PREDICTED: ubiquitin-like-specific protease 1D isoform X2 [Lupinus angustifolius]
MEEQIPKSHKPLLSLDWNLLLPDAPDSHAPPPELRVLKPSDPMASDGPDHLSDHQLLLSIQSKKSTLENTGKGLPDRGAKLRATIQNYEDELTRRKAKRQHEEFDEDQRRKQAAAAATSTSVVGVSNDLTQENESSQAPPESSFSSCFVKKMEDDTDCTTVNAFSKDISHFKHCNNQTARENGEPRERKRHRSSSRCASNLSKRNRSNHDKSSRTTSAYSQHSIGKYLFRFVPKMKDVSQATQSDGLRSRKGQPIVLDDDDDEGPNIPEKIEEENKLPEYLKEAKIYYPTRDDPECVEVCYKDIDCLAPEGYLTSTIMNFYIRYLKQQASLANRLLSDYHFFNTFFYKKLKEAVSNKQSDRERFFAKFRRWWKGVNIFQKPYILIPIHEDLHWSLIIICIPDKEDESGPIILHLDSLGLHSSKSVFNNIKSYLLDEKNYLDKENLSSDVPIAEKIWNWLPRRIDTQPIAVPQQKNESDCGLFVLYFIQRFIEEAPERLKKKDLDMFGKRWFKPEEASSLRVKIRKLLIAELRNTVSESSSLAASADPAIEECVDTANDSS